MKKITALIMAGFMFLFPLFADMITFSSDSIRVALRAGQEQTMLAGNARVNQGRTVITAKTITLFGASYSTAVCIGDVRIVDSDTQSVITGGYARHQADPKYANITENPKLELRRDGVVVTSSIMERFWDDGRNVATGNVVITKGEMVAYNERATYYENEDKIVLDGSPRVTVGDDEYFADSITLITTNNDILMEGNVQVVLYPHDTSAYEGLGQ